MASYSPILGNPKPQYEDTLGVPYVGMRLFFYVAGTSTKQDTATDSGGLTTNTNPVVIGADGYPESNVMLYGDNSFIYKVVAAPPGSDDPPTSPLWTINNIYPTEGSLLTALASTAVGSGADLVANVVKVYDVVDYGGTGDDATDNSSAALTAATAMPATGGTLYFRSDTVNTVYRIANLVLPDKPIRILIDQGATLLHSNSAASHMIVAVNDFKVEGGVLDGNKANQTGRYDVINFIGDNLDVTKTHIKNTVANGIYVGGADTVNISHNRFTDIGEHGGILNETAYAIHCDTTLKLTRIHVDHNFFINGTPSNVLHAPTAIILSMPNTFCDNSTVIGNTVYKFGTKFSGNQTGSIEIYNTCDSLTVADNKISQYYYTGLRVNDSGRTSITGNSVVDAAVDIGSGESAFAYVCKNHGSVAKTDSVISNNIIDNQYQGGMYISGGGSGFELSRVITHDNIIVRAGSTGIYHAWTDGEVNTHHNMVENTGSYGIRIENCSGSMHLNANNLDNNDSGIFARTSITNLDLKVSNNTIDTSTNYGMTLRSMNSCVVIDNEYRGASPVSADFDYTVTSGRVTGNSWQNGQYAKTTAYTITTADIGKTFTNEGASASVEFTLPDITTLPISYWVRVIVLAAQQVDFDPANTDQIFPTTNAAGDRLRNTGVIGDNVTLEYTHADGWSEVNELGTWTDAN